MAKKLRDIAGKGQFAGVKSSKVAPPDIDDKNFYQWNAADGVKFIKKHDTEKHDYPYDAEAAFKGKKDGGSKTTNYKFQKDGVYEGIDEGCCNHTMEGVMCEVHGESACPTKENDVNAQKKSKKDEEGREYLADKKKHSVEEGRIEDDAQRKAAKQLSAIAAKSNVPVTKLKPGKKSYNQLKSTGSMFGGARQFAAGVAKRNIEAGAEHKSSVGKAKVGGKLKEESLDEVAPPSAKIEKWINSNKERFVKQYGKEKGMQVLYAKAWKMHGQSESGSATNTDYVGPGAAGLTTGRLDVGTL